MVIFEDTNWDFRIFKVAKWYLKKGRGHHTKYLPFAFTEQGLAMLSGILNSDKAIEVNISIMRTFVVLRQYALSYLELNNKLENFMM